ncbi:RND family efflux transporter MFP subunit [Rhodoferax ferrireducens]|uniref:RND family efflux transporter MFP subunit n=1 Tax=Rhodoferax ferrireducens TaxID=192843 RepID=A0ABU2CBB3_9BURK|nr:efflux RND transporter periplasmic adaptor subunit [Rhodoferax ferrireducens]MDR7378629.1 RND family efflux transporter MFP subunit [Rhodoferax ferrireducens]
MTPIAFKPNAIVFAAALAIITCAGGLFATYSRAADEDKVAQPKAALTVTTVQPQQSPWTVQLSANGNVAAWQEASIGSEANGLRLLEVRANVGDVVRAGQVLATFAADSVQADVAQAKANLLEAEANALDAAGNASRARTLQTTGALSEQQINQYLTTEQVAKARVEAAKATLVVQQQRLKHTQVLAPDSGTISARSATVGAVLASGTELFRMVRQGRLEWRAEVTAAELERIKVGTQALVSTANGTPVKGKVRMVAPTVDPQTRMGLVYVDLQSNLLKPGMFAKGAFELGQSAALTVPQTAVVVRDAFSYVYRVGADKRVARVKVQTGRQIGDRLEITSGLDANALLVASGAGFLNDGDLVRVVETSKPNTAPAQAKPAQAASK